jgi:hypothetical protein
MAEQITITIQTGNAAFEDAPASEVARILRDLADRFENEGALDATPLRDHNGNKVGVVRIEPL